MWFRRKNIDQLEAGSSLAGTDRIVVAQGTSEAKWSLLSGLFTYVTSTLGSMATQNANAVNLTGGSMTSVAVHGLPAPSASADAATKSYVDALALNVAGRGSVRLASTANVTIATGLASGQAIDGVTLATGDLVLLKNQSTASQNGIYVAPASSAAARAPQFDTWAELPGSLIAVEEGTVGAETLWICTSDVGGTLGTTAVNFTRIRIDIAIPVTAAQGGLGADASAFTGILKFAAGVASVLSFDLDGALAANSDTRISSQKAIKTYVDGKSGVLQSKIVTATRDLTAASGSVAYTGVGFQPSCIIALSFVNATATFGVGVSDSTKASNAMSYYGSNLVTAGSVLINAFLADSSASNHQTASVSTYDSDGFTLSWSKIGSPTGTANVYFLCLR